MNVTTTFRKSIMWLVLVALLAPGLALARAACCEPELAKPASCCAQAMTMPRMDGAQMQAMGGMAGQDALATSGMVDCSPGPASEVLEFALPIAKVADGSILFAIDQHPAVVSQLATGSSSEDLHFILAGARPPRAILSDPLNTILRI